MCVPCLQAHCPRHGQRAFPPCSSCGCIRCPLQDHCRRLGAAMALFYPCKIWSCTKLSGPLPAEWGSPTGFQKLQKLICYSCNISGKPYKSSCSLSMCTSFGKTQLIQGLCQCLLAQADELDIRSSHSKWAAMADIKCLQVHCQPAGATQALSPCCQI